MADTYHDGEKRIVLRDSKLSVRNLTINFPATKLHTEVNPISNKKRQSHQP